jgi:hypothetical protein
VTQAETRLRHVRSYAVAYLGDADRTERRDLLVSDGAGTRLGARLAEQLGVPREEAETAVREARAVLVGAFR